MVCENAIKMDHECSCAFLQRLLQYKDKFTNETIPTCAVTNTAAYMTLHSFSQLFQHMEGEENKRENDLRERDNKMYRMRS